MRSKITRAAILLLIAVLTLLSGCASDNGKGRGAVNVVREAANAEYSMATVRRGDLSLTETVRVSYFAARQESYGFDVSGLYYESFFVSVGDEVKTGDILATLESSELDAEIAACETDIVYLENDIARNTALLELYDARTGGNPLDAKRRVYEVAIRDDRDEIALLNARLSEYSQKRAGRVIYAAIDGTVTFVREVGAGETSVKGRTIITVTDLSSCAFSATMENPSAIKNDAIYTVAIDGADYEITPATAMELGIKDEPMNEKSTRTRLYFALLTPSVNLTDDSSGKFTVTVDTREDAIYVPASCVTLINGEQCVYVPDENGLRSIRKVTVGLKTIRNAEILDGLAEGENVIMN